MEVSPPGSRSVFRQGGRGQKIPNHRAWRDYLAARLKSTTVFDTRERQFYRKADGEDWLVVNDDQMRDALRQLVVTAPVDTAASKSRITDEWLSRLVSRLKTSLAMHLPVVETRMHAFVDQHLVKSPGSNVTNAELTMAFEAHCQRTGQPALSSKKFKVLAGRVLRGKAWLCCYSKSLRRPGGDQNGWRGVRLKDESMMSKTTGGAHGADGAEI